MLFSSVEGVSATFAFSLTGFSTFALGAAGAAFGATGVASPSTFGLRGGKLSAIIEPCGQASSHLRQDLHLL